MTHFCPSCWTTLAADADRCPFCGCDLAAAAARSYPERLVGALRHPEPETRLRVAEILGYEDYPQAIGPLLARARECLREHPPDAPFLAALLRSARRLGAPGGAIEAILAASPYRT